MPNTEDNNMFLTQSISKTATVMKIELKETKSQYALSEKKQ